MSSAKKWPTVEPAKGFRKTTTSDNAGPTSTKDTSTKAEQQGDDGVTEPIRTLHVRWKCLYIPPWQASMWRPRLVNGTKTFHISA